MTMTLIETITVGSGGATSIEFTSIPQDGVELYAEFSTRSNNSALVKNIRIYFNGQTGGTYPTCYIDGNGSSTQFSNTGYSFGGRTNSAGSTAGTFTSTGIRMPNYTSTGTHLSLIESVAENAAAECYLFLAAQGLTTSGAITSMKFETSSADTLLEHSSASLYTIS